MARVELAWELGAHTGHVSTLLPIGRALKALGHDLRFFLQQPAAGADLEGAQEIPREGAPHWVGPRAYQDPLNLGEILANFGYHDAGSLKQLVDARSRRTCCARWAAPTSWRTARCASCRRPPAASVAIPSRRRVAACSMP